MESLLADELRALRIKGVRPQRAGVLFAGGVDAAYRALLWSRLASRVLLQLAVVPASSDAEFYAAVADLRWEDHVRAGGTIAVDANGTNDALRDTRYTAVRAKDAIADRFRERFGRRPSVDTASPDLRVNVAVRPDRATVSIDLAGEPLHRRGYREPGVQVVAPMKETLAAAMLAVAGWERIARDGGAFVDPMCGSGTLCIEAALIAGDVAPGLLRRSHPVTRWLGHDQAMWERLTIAAEKRRDAGLTALPPIEGSDYDERAVEVARSNVRRAGLAGRVSIERRSLSMLRPPEGTARGLVATNPPYGERLADRASLPALYAELGGRLRAGFSGWSVAVITPDQAADSGLGLKPVRSHELYNGRILSPVRVFEVAAASDVEPAASRRVPSAPPAPEAATRTAPGTPAPSATGGAPAFSNRLRKMAKHYGKWARRAGVTCYRVYDADLPDYAVAVDLYQGAGPDEGRRWAHVSEYAAPSEVDAVKAAARLGDVLAEVPSALDVDPADVFLKRRERQRNTAQYERVAKRGVGGVVKENGLLFEVNLSDYLDTGLFLDHRDTRSRVREMASGTHFLNLFAYTGSVSVYAASGGAVSTTTVDLSATYLDWAGRNMARNGFSGSAHRLEREDVLSWVDAARGRGERYDLIFCDPPTFSNSKRMDESWDVQRDHGRLLALVGDLLSEGGTIVFSCNRRKFTLDEESLAAAGLVASDITTSTIPKDFERRAWVHWCWTIRHA